MCYILLLSRLCIFHHAIEQTGGENLEEGDLKEIFCDFFILVKQCVMNSKNLKTLS